MGELDGKVAIVTGAGRGTGELDARKLAAAGAHVVVSDRTGGHDGPQTMCEGGGMADATDVEVL